MYWCFSYNYFMASNNLNFSLLQEQRCCSTSSLLVGFPLTLFQLLPEFTVLYLLFSTHSVHYFIFLTTTKLAFSQSCITTSASSEGCHLRAHHYYYYSSLLQDQQFSPGCLTLPIHHISSNVIASSVLSKSSHSQAPTYSYRPSTLL